MIRVDEVRGRIEDQVPELANRLAGAGQFAALVQKNQLPQQTPAGFVLPGSLVGGPASMGAGAFVQDFVETLIIVLVVRVANDPTSSAALDEISPLVRRVITTLLGWGPDDAPGVFVLSKGELVGTQDGALIYQIDFSLADQVRIT